MEFNAFAIDKENRFIKVKDDAKSNLFLRRCLQFIWMANGLLHLELFFETKEKSNLIIFFIGLICFVLFILDFRKSFLIKIAFEEIKEIKYKRVFFQNNLFIILKNNKTQMINVELSKENITSIRVLFEENKILFIA